MTEPYYLDFETSGNYAIRDGNGKIFMTPRSISTFRDQIDHRFIAKNIDYTEKYPSDKVDRSINVDPANQFDGQSHYNFNGDNTLARFGINSSSTRSLKTMSPAFFEMKQAQERTQLDRVNGAINADLDYLKYKQALERQTRSESSDGFNTGTSAGTGCLNADGELVPFNRNNYLKPSKYDHLKHMSPDILNKMQGKPVAGDVLPPAGQGEDDGDVFLSLIHI